MLLYIKRQIASFRLSSISEKLILILVISIFLPSIPYYPFQPSALVTIFTAIFILINKERRITVYKTMHSPIIIVFFVLLLIVPLYYKNYFGFLVGFLLDLYFIIALYARSFMTIRFFEKICCVCCTLSIFCAIIGIIQKISGAFDRATAVFFNANFYAYIIELVIIVAVYRLLTDKKYKLFYLLTIAINLGAIFLTDCRSAWLGMFFGVFVIFIILKKPIHSIISTIIALTITASVYIFPWLIPRIFMIERASSIRIHIWIRAMQDFYAHPFLGRGMLAFYQVSGNIITPHAHNIFIDMLECFGIIGSIALLIYLVYMIINMKKNFKSGDFQQKASIAFAFGIMCCTLVHGITDVPYVGIQTGALLFILMTARSAKTEVDNE
jgi:O-antigen ligase